MRKRLLVPALFAALLAFAAAPAVAQTSDSVTEELIWGLNNNLLAIAIPITLLVEGILIYTVWKYRKSDEALPTQENRRLEITWTITTALVLLFVGFASYGVMADPFVASTQQEAQQAMQQDDTVVVEAVGYQWAWDFNYPEQNVTSNTMVVPTNRTVVIQVVSRDVLHAFHAPGLGLKTDAFPGKTTYIVTRINEEGTYQMYCAEYCGSGHSKMLAEIEVRSESGYEQWLSEQSGSGSGGNQSGGNQSNASANAVAPA